MQGMIRCALVAGLLCACHTDDTGTPDGTTSGAAALSVQWGSKPDTWPAQIQDGLTLESATFAFDSLRVIGDAGPGDTRTSASNFGVQWDNSHSPESIQFTDAPTGLYSQLSMQIDGHVINDSYELKGKVRLNGSDINFQIEDRSALAVTLSIEKTVSPGATSTVRVEVDFANALGSVQWDTLRTDDGHLELSTLDAGIVDFRKKLIESFQSPNSASGVAAAAADN